ncbi:MAG: hypothetical protein KIT02_09660 [Devosia sp.]|uniref:hypothetical protein n=1 Tax=Devosia sp. TaxID=1871048 RepID=UPI0024C5E185|nr:hypothetical protein [Devosia sp.]UYN98240.1 MAG: hypothetical protein KIT02_09660 [Devosia sp.]
MDDVFRLLLFIHIGALLFAAATNIIMPALVPRMMALGAEGRATLGPLTRQLSINARLSLAVLVTTGLLMVAIRYDAGLWSNPWFAAKMACVAAIILALVIGFTPWGKSIPPKVFGLVTRLALIGTIFCAVLAFN